MMTHQELTALLDELPALRNPEVLRLACGHDVPNQIGTRVFDYYGWHWSKQSQTTDAELSTISVDTSGKLPYGITYWVFQGSDNSRVCCETCGNNR